MIGQRKFMADFTRLIGKFQVWKDEWNVMEDRWLQLKWEIQDLVLTWVQTMPFRFSEGSSEGNHWQRWTIFFFFIFFFFYFFLMKYRKTSTISLVSFSVTSIGIKSIGALTESSQLSYGTVRIFKMWWTKFYNTMDSRFRMACCELSSSLRARLDSSLSHQLAER